jgi:hypothetical protein
VTDGDATNFNVDLKRVEDALRESRRKARSRRNSDATRRSAKSKKNAKPLSSATLADLKRSGLDAKDAAIMGIESLSAEEAEGLFETPRAGYKIPYSNFDRVVFGFFRFRYTDFIPTQVFGGEVQITKQLKYMQPAGSGVHAYLSRHIDWNDVLDDPTIPVISTEGEKKAAAACKAGLITVGLGGVDAFASSKRDIDLLPELVRLAPNRRMPIVYDSDIVNKKEVRLARKKLALQIYLAGGFPEFIDLPSGDNDAKIGLDDYLMAHSKKEFLALPRQEITAQLLIRWLHNKKKEEKLGFDPETTARLIGRVVTQAMVHGGQFLQTDMAKPELLYHDRASAKIFELDEGRGRKLRAFVQKSYSVNGADPQWQQVHEQAANHCMSHGLRVKVHKLFFTTAKLTPYM